MKYNIYYALNNPTRVALLVAIIFSMRFIHCLPFSEYARIFNSETVITVISYFIFAAEPISFPLGDITNITFPFVDGNVGNVGAMPFFAIIFKVMGKFFSYFQTFNYFVLVEILSSFFTAYFSLKILVKLGVDNFWFRLLGALLLGTSFIMLVRSDIDQPFCVVMFPLFAIWIYSMLLVMQEDALLVRKDFLIVFIFPMASIIDNYTLVGIVLGTGSLVVFEFYETFFGGLVSSRNRFIRLFCILIAGICLSILSLYIIGMYPLPSVAGEFTSYDSGMGGRYHVADLLAPFIPIGNHDVMSHVGSLLGQLNYIPNTNVENGHYLGVAYIGTANILIWLFVLISILFSYKNILFKYRNNNTHKLDLSSPWRKVGIAAIFVFVYSLGYELHILGTAFPNFNLMPAAWLSDRIPALYNIRATNRLATLLSMIIMLQGIRLLYDFYENKRSNIINKEPCKYYKNVIHVFLVCVVIIHFFEIAPLLKPVAVQPSYPVGGVYSEDDIKQLRQLGTSHDVVLIAPSVYAVNFDIKWSTEVYSLAYYLGLPSNLSVIARTIPQHNQKLLKDLDRVSKGEWDSLIDEYGNVLFALSKSMSDLLRPKMQGRFLEVKVGTISLWSKAVNAT